MQTSLVCIINRASLHHKSGYFILQFSIKYGCCIFFFFAHKAANAVQCAVFEYVTSCILIFSKKRTVHRFARSTHILRAPNDANIVFNL